MLRGVSDAHDIGPAPGVTALDRPPVGPVVPGALPSVQPVPGAVGATGVSHTSARLHQLANAGHWQALAYTSSATGPWLTRPVLPDPELRVQSCRTLSYASSPAGP